MNIVGGILLSLLVVYFQFKYFPLDISEGIKYGSDFIFFKLKNSQSFSYFLVTLGILWGSFISANISKNFSIRIVSKNEFFKGILGGALMGLGASLAGGCNISGFYISMANLSGSAILMMIGLFIGIYVGTLYQARILEKKQIIGGKEIRFPKLNLPLGIIFFFLLILTRNYLLILGAIVGFLLQKSKFCMLNAFKDPFFSGSPYMSLSLILSLTMVTFGIGFLKMKNIQEPMMFVNPVFGWGSFVGGIFFGLGMVLAGGGSIESIWRMGEGQVKFLFVLLSFSTVYSFIKRLLENYKVTLGIKVYLPFYFGYLGSFGLILGILLVLSFIVIWNYKTKKLVKVIL